MTPELLATHQIIALFEKSKGLSDQIFDDLSGIFFHFDSQGNILRANKVLSKILNIDFEEILGVAVTRLFKDPSGFQAQWKRFNTKPLEALQFELPIQTHAGESFDYLWQMSMLETGTGTRRGPIYTCVGRDISEVKRALAQVVTLAKDLELAEAMQNLLLPDDNHFQNQHISLAAYYKAAAISGGDYWFFEEVAENKVWILVGDVTGHGAGAAMVTALVSGCVQTLRIIAREREETPDLAALMSTVNQNLTRIKDQPYWMTLIAIEIDFNSESLLWYGSAAPPVFVLTPDGEVEVFNTPSSPLGVGETKAASHRLPFPKGARILVPTDGVTECANEAGTQFGLRRVVKALTASQKLPVGEARDHMVAELTKWSGSTPADDDITFVLVEKF